MAKSYLKKIIEFIFIKYKNLTNFLKEDYKKSINLIKKYNSKIIYIFSFISSIIIYGIILSLILNTFISLEFSLKSIVSLGFIYYFFKVEFPPILRSCIPNNKNTQ